MAQADGIIGYREFLKSRDGTPDVHGPSLSRREEFFARIDREPLRSKRCFDREVFLRNVKKAWIEDGLDERMMWLVWTAKSNQAERFGVELARLYGQLADEGDPPEDVHPGLQEFYHTRILADVVAMFDLPVPMSPPPAVPRTLIYLMVHSPFPERFNLPLVGASEMLGCVMFRLLRDRGVALFADEPEVAQRIRLLFDEILADELCHVGLIEAKLGRFGRSVMHKLFRGMTRGSTHPRSPLVKAFGAEVVRQAYLAPFELDALVAEFPDTAYAF